MLEQNKATAKRYIIELWEKGNLDIIEDVFTPNFQGHLFSPSEGFAGIRENVSHFLNAFTSGVIKIDDLFGEGDKIILRWRYEAVHTGSFKNIPPTGKNVVISGMTIERFEEGKIAELWAQIDIFDLLKQLDVIKD
jgi:predicted ester cyclase